MDGSLLKKTVTAIRNQLETAREQEVEVIDLEAPNTNFIDNQARPKTPSLGIATDDAVLASVARPTLATAKPPPQEHLLSR